jgi:hypothetical protein
VLPDLDETPTKELSATGTDGKTSQNDDATVLAPRLAQKQRFVENSVDVGRLSTNDATVSASDDHNAKSAENPTEREGFEPPTNPRKNPTFLNAAAQNPAHRQTATPT